ncbi:MAG TPA: hypothetical protein V6C99_04005 [Oculatellaceae cyanobacterium]|jgi:hypothetical protein
MSQLDLEILQLAQRIQLLSGDGNRKSFRDEDELFYRLAKIRELANALVPRVEAQSKQRLAQASG